MYVCSGLPDPSPFPDAVRGPSCVYTVANAPAVQVSLRERALRAEYGATYGTVVARCHGVSPHSRSRWHSANEKIDCSTELLLKRQVMTLASRVPSHAMCFADSNTQALLFARLRLSIRRWRYFAHFAPEMLEWV